ncbi:MAG: DUF4870 domain-containing protein [Verrucomicrobiales bacterium]|nr:DUF4870 domain-containing protein [Verrucomicrobiales bacterium]
MDDSNSEEKPPAADSSPAPETKPTNPEPAPSDPAAAQDSSPDPTPSEADPSESESSETPPASEPSPVGMGGVALGQGDLAETDERTMALLAHILGAVTSIVGPLIIWLIKKDESPFVNDQGKEALNFQITVLIGYVATGIVAVLPVIGCIAGILYPAVMVVSLVFAILGGMEANKGVAYRYPFAARFVS